VILSKTLRLIFIKGQKVGGTSVEMALAGLCGPDDIITPVTGIDERERLGIGRGAQNFAADPADEAPFLAAIRTAPVETLAALKKPAADYFNHMSLRRVIALQGAAIEGFDIVGMERDPYAKILSFANMQLRWQAYQEGKGLTGASPDQIRQSARDIVASGKMDQVCNIDLYKDGTGEIAARLLRYEDFENEVRSLLRRHDPAWDGLIPHAKRGPLSNALGPQGYFDRDSLDRINDRFAEEFERFGYPQL
jgi:hypothetical protein